MRGGDDGSAVSTDKDPSDENAVAVAASAGRSSLGDSGANKIILLTPHPDESRKAKGRR